MIAGGIGVMVALVGTYIVLRVSGLTQAQEKIPAGEPSEEPDVVSTKAEGGLQSEAGVLEEQARQSQPLREGENLLPNVPDSFVSEEPARKSPAKSDLPRSAT